MKKITIDIYSIIFNLTNSKVLAFSLALAYITILNYVLFQGIVFLLKEGFGALNTLEILFRKPYFIGTILVLLAAHFYLSNDITQLSPKQIRRPNVTRLILFTCLGLLLFAYCQFNELLFQ